MNAEKRLLVTCLAFIAFVTTAVAQINFGVKAGAKINDLRFEQDFYQDAYNPGFTVGLTMEYMFPNTDVGFDVSIMYFNVQTEFLEYNSSASYHTHFIDMPINFKWKIDLPVAKDIVRPYLTTGPGISVIGGERQVKINNIRYNVAAIDWGLGVGVELFKHAQIGVSYAFGLTNAFETFGYKGIWTDIPGKKNNWTISATYMF